MQQQRRQQAQTKFSLLSTEQVGALAGHRFETFSDVPPDIELSHLRFLELFPEPRVMRAATKLQGHEPLGPRGFCAGLGSEIYSLNVMTANRQSSLTQIDQ